MPHPERLAALQLEPRAYHLVVARFEPENHVSEIVQGYVSSNVRVATGRRGRCRLRGQTTEPRCSSPPTGDPRVLLPGEHVGSGPSRRPRTQAPASYLHGHSVGGTNPSLLRAMGAGAPVIANSVPFNHEVAGRTTDRYFSNPEELARECEQRRVGILRRQSETRRGWPGRHQQQIPVGRSCRPVREVGASTIHLWANEHRPRIRPIGNSARSRRAGRRRRSARRPSARGALQTMAPQSHAWLVGQR